MSTKSRLGDTPQAAPPYVAARLRLAWQVMRGRMLRAIHDAGFRDFQEAHFGVFSYPLPNGAKPSELARQRQMSRQAINYLISQLEELDYVERRPIGEGQRRLVYLTARGEAAAQVIFECLRQLQVEWARLVGQDRFDVFLDVLDHLGGEAGPVGAAESASGRAGPD